MTVENDMKLPPGRSCGDCLHHRRCVGLFGCKPTNTHCDWSPSRFRARPVVHAASDFVPPREVTSAEPWSPYP